MLRPPAAGLLVGRRGPCPVEAPVLILSICFIALSLFSEGFVITHADHDCHGEGCPLCLQIEWTRNFFQQFRYVPFQSPFIPNSPLFSALVLKTALFRPIPISSVALKVKMNR
jgi:hypothetical protein